MRDGFIDFLGIYILNLGLFKYYPSYFFCIDKTATIYDYIDISAWKHFERICNDLLQSPLVKFIAINGPMIIRVIFVDSTINNLERKI